MVTDEMQQLPLWLISAIRAQTPHFGTMGDWTQTSGLGRTLSNELADAGVLPTVMIGNRRWINIWAGLALFHEATNTKQTIAVPGETRERELARKAELRAKARQVREEHKRGTRRRRQRHDHDETSPA